MAEDRKLLNLDEDERGEEVMAGLEERCSGWRWGCCLRRLRQFSMAGLAGWPSSDSRSPIHPKIQTVKTSLRPIFEMDTIRGVRTTELKNVYINKRPKEYYGARGQRISWDHYLLGHDKGVGTISTANLKRQ